MSNGNHHINYTAADIERYHTGNMSKEEMHAIEKAALDDPFLMEAMDGYMQAGTMVKKDIDELHVRLQERTSAVKQLPQKEMPWWRIAAAAIVMAGAFMAYWLLNNSRSTDGIAASQQTNNASVGPVIKQDSTSVAATTTSPSTEMRADTQHHTDRDVAVNNNINNKPIAGKATISLPPVSKDTITTELAKADDNARKQLLEEKETFSKDKNITPAPMQANYQQPINSFNGIVVDSFNKPIPNATVMLQGKSAGTLTDKNGKFSLSATDSVANVSVASVGYDIKNFKLNNSNNPAANRLVLQQSNRSLSEVVVSGFGAAKKTSRSKNQALTVKVLDTEPLTGWEEYNNYLEKNKQVPDALKDIHGNVVISFEVNKDNTLSKFKIEKSLQEILDNEAIRLIKNGPGWHLLKGKKAKASVVVKF